MAHPPSPTSRERLSLGVLIALAVAGVALLVLIVAPFVSGLVWAFAFAVVAEPVHRRIVRVLKRRDLAAGIGVLAVTLVLVLPTSFVAWQIGHEARRSIGLVQEQIESGAWRGFMQRDPRLARAYDFIASRVDVGEQLDAMATGVPSTVAFGSVQLLIALFTLFFFFRDRPEIIRFIRSLMPLSDRETDYFFERIQGMTHATIYGTVVVALVQGALGGLMFMLLGIPGAFLWGVVMAVLSVVPNLGSFIVWIPAALVLALQGAWIKAAILAGWGVFVVGTIDNVLYPMLVGHEMRLHTLPVFLSILGGLLVFGAAGLVLGPVILAATVAILEILRRRTEHAHSAAEPA